MHTPKTNRETLSPPMNAGTIYIPGRPDLSGDILESPLLISCERYEEDELAHFTEIAYRPTTSSIGARYATVRSADTILESEWHVPCVALLFATPEDEYQMFHMEPTYSGYAHPRQEAILRDELANIGCRYIAVHSHRGIFGNADNRILGSLGMEQCCVIRLDTSQWWRIMYFPETDEIWIEMKVKKVFLKLR